MSRAALAAAGLGLLCVVSVAVGVGDLRLAGIGRDAQAAGAAVAGAANDMKR